MTATVQRVQRVQRVAEQWPVLHLEAAVPVWDALVVDGLVGHPRRFTMEDLRSLGSEQRSIPLHCVWGWSRPVVTWEGVSLDALLDLVVPGGDHLTVHAAGGDYSSSLTLEDARRGFLAWSRDGEALTGEAGGPLRFVGPSTHWAYKGVKWAARLTSIDGFVAGFWESKVADPAGRIPEEVQRP